MTLVMLLAQVQAGLAAVVVVLDLLAATRLRVTRAMVELVWNGQVAAAIFTQEEAAAVISITQPLVLVVLVAVVVVE